MINPSELVTRLYADPPRPHVINGENSAGWATERSAYDFIAQHLRPGSRTVETGCGMSTALFALAGCKHTCITYEQAEVDYIRAYVERLTGRSCTVEFHVGSSADILPTLDLGARDLVFIDGSHSWPMATIDWFYASSSLVRDGVLVLDDTPLKQVTLGLKDFLDKDPRWLQLQRGWKWSAYRRLSSGSLLDEWWLRDQPFLGVPLRLRLGKHVPPAARPALKRLAVQTRKLLP